MPGAPHWEAEMRIGREAVEAAASIGEESEDPRRSIPRALIGTVAVAAGFFVLMAYAFSLASSLLVPTDQFVARYG